MKPFLGVVMALVVVLVRALGRKTATHGNCVGDLCLTVHTDSVSFNAAQTSCVAKGGHLMTVRTSVANNAIADVLSGYTGNFWIGLRYYMKDTAHDLKGYTWVTGDDATNFTNWKSSGGDSTPRCVSLSTDDPRWTESDCDHLPDGYLCEYKNTDKCTRLQGSPIVYETPFGFAREDLRDVPNASNATHQHLGTRYVCFEGRWIKAPWNCEVYKGGCEHECEKWNNTSVCTCPPGYKLESNAIRCSKLHDDDDPCLQSRCSHTCVVKGDSYVCQCRTGYELGDDGKTCRIIDHCDRNQRSCPDDNSYCVNTPGGFECLCKDGYRKEQDTCEDDDECFSGPCEHVCVNTIGSYDCACSDGYKVSSENKHMCTIHCPDMECPAVVCDLNNSHQCECPRGFLLEERDDGNFCVDINECDISVCDQECENTPGDYVCFCNEGFRLTDKSRCVKTKVMSTTESVSVFISTSRSPPIKTASLLSPGALLGVVVCTLIVILLMVGIIYHYMKCCGKMTTDKGHGKALEQVTIEKSITNFNYKTSRL